MHARGRAQVEADFAGKSDEQIMAEGEEETRRTERRERAAEQLMVKPAIYASVVSGERTIDSMTPGEHEEIHQWGEAMKSALPPEVSPFTQGPIILRNLTSLNGDKEGPIPGAALAFDHVGYYTGADGHPEPRFFNRFPWQNLHGIEVSDQRQVQERITAPRAAAFGLFSLGMKKRQVSSFLSLTVGFGAPERYEIYEVPGVEPIQLQAQVSPAAFWLSQNYTAIQAFAA